MQIAPANNLHLPPTQPAPGAHWVVAAGEHVASSASRVTLVGAQYFRGPVYLHVPAAQWPATHKPVEQEDPS